MKYYKCLTQDEFENLEEGTEMDDMIDEITEVVTNKALSN